MAKQGYKLGKGEAKVIYADLLKVSASDKEAIQMYVNAGYELRKPVKSKTKGDKITKAEMLDALKNDEKNLKILQKKIADKENFMKIKKWYRDLQA